MNVFCGGNQPMNRIAKSIPLTLTLTLIGSGLSSMSGLASTSSGSWVSPAAEGETAAEDKTVVAARSNPCPTDVFLDVSNFEGPGPGYPAPHLEASCTQDSLVIRGNGIPHYEFVPITPNPLRAREFEYRLPRNPTLADRPTSIPLLGTIAIAVNGVAIFGPNEGPQPSFEAFGDPIYNSIMDTCMGHTANVYHYHALLVKCLSERPVAKGKPSPIIGYSFDGFPIYGPYGCLDSACRQVVEFKSSWKRIGNPQTNAWNAHRYENKNSPVHLDQCNGRIGPDGRYRYHATFTFPYILGCYRGVVPSELMNRGPRGRAGSPDSSNGPGGFSRPGNSGRSGPGNPPNRAGVPSRSGPGRSGRSRPGGHPDLAAAASRLGISEQQLRNALGPPPPDLVAAARRLGISEQQLRNALGVPGNGRGRTGNSGRRPPRRDSSAGLGRPGNVIQLGSNPSGRLEPERRPDLAAAARRLRISEQTLRNALGPPPPDLAAAARKLGISEQTLHNALDFSSRRGQTTNPERSFPNRSGAAGCSLTSEGEVTC